MSGLVADCRQVPPGWLMRNSVRAVLTSSGPADVVRAALDGDQLDVPDQPGSRAIRWYGST
jgi:hypothetical protein